MAPTCFFHHITLYCSSFIEQITSDRFRWQKSSYGQITSKWHQHGFFIISLSTVALSLSKSQVTDLGGKSPAMAILPQSGTKNVVSSFYHLLRYHIQANKSPILIKTTCGTLWLEATAAPIQLPPCL